MSAETDLPLILASSPEGEMDVSHIIGRMTEGGGGDQDNEFDFLPRTEGEMIDQNDEEAEVFAGDEDVEAVPFEPPAEETFPVFKTALRHFMANEPKSRALRVDTDPTFGEMVCESAVRELDRRVRELRGALEGHIDEHSTEKHPGYRKKPQRIRVWDEVLGAVQAVKDLHLAKTTGEAIRAMDEVPLDLPAESQGKVKCWRNGDSIICSMRFSVPDGSSRIATMAARPRVNESEIVGWAMGAGVHPVTVLGAARDLADVACGKKLVRDVAGAALAARRRMDVCGMEDGDEPLLLASPGTSESTAPLAALMYTEQRADQGDPLAKKEMSKMRSAAKTPLGKKVAAPLLAESTKRLAQGRVEKAAKQKKQTLAQRYSLMSMWL
jgi:hypothetical protein